jgi:two-component system chemotaxis response regulator CheY
MKIAVIEDDVFFQKFYSTRLAEKGYEIVVASDGEEGIEKIRTEHPNAVLLDIIMPKKNGFELLEDMQKDPELSKIPVLVFSTLGQEDDVKRAMSLGAKDYINKSFFDFNNLVAKIAEIAK